MPVADPESILIVKPSSLGDVVHTLPCAAILKRRWPKARLSWLINEEWAPLLDGNPFVDEVVLFPRQQFRGAGVLTRLAPWARQMRTRHQADLVLDFQGLLRSALISQLCRARGGHVAGLSDAREGARFFYDSVVELSTQIHAVDRYLGLLGTLGLKARGLLEWPLPAGSEPDDGDLPAAPFIVLHPFSRGEGKSLSEEEVTAFCQGSYPTPVVIAGRSAVQLPAIENATSLLNSTTLPELIWLLRRAAWVVSVDSGPMHIASALTGKLVAIHTWSDPAKVGPYNPAARVWSDGQLFHGRRCFEATAQEMDLRELGAWVREQVITGR